jgi:hypothetical protein
MITLQVENYCQNCLDFKPYCSVFRANDETVETLVQCTKKDRCKKIKAYIEGQMTRKERPDYMPTTADIFEGCRVFTEEEDE